MLLQPQHHWAEGKVTHQGTAFVVRNAQGQDFAVSSSHYLDFSGPPLMRVVLLDIRNSVPRAESRSSFGRPGTGGLEEPIRDLNEDLLILPITTSESVAAPVRVTASPHLTAGTAVWLPDKTDQEKIGHVSVPGRITEVSAGYVRVELDRPIVLSSQSGPTVLAVDGNDLVGVLRRCM